MKKIFNKSYIVLIALFCILLIACTVYSEETQEDHKSELQEQFVKQYINALKVAEEELTEMTIEQEKSEEPIEAVSAFKLPDDVFIIEISRNYNGDQEALTLKDGLLQFWVNENMVCEKQIPLPAELSIGRNFYEVIGNPYISKDGEMVLIQSYITPEGNQLDYTILIKNCSKIIPTLNCSYVFKNYEGKYGLVFYSDGTYAGFGFNTVDSNFILPKPTIIWLNESTVKSVNFGSWGSASYGYQDISNISVRLDVESYGELVIASVCDFEPIEVEESFFDLLYEKFTPDEYDAKFVKVIKTLNEYKQKR